MCFAISPAVLSTIRICLPVAKVARERPRLNILTDLLVIRNTVQDLDSMRFAILFSLSTLAPFRLNMHCAIAYTAKLRIHCTPLADSPYVYLSDVQPGFIWENRAAISADFLTERASHADDPCIFSHIGDVPGSDFPGAMSLPSDIEQFPFLDVAPRDFKIIAKITKNYTITEMDVLVTENPYGQLGHSVYSKPTYTEIYLNANSH
ncbi:hypothetical protein PR048_012569 [Dryococelus australis]|uniref:Uncharacterized protein n=1 Tax=Dryococelus australis TaxID=614101 RepID=A0ABQ9HR61_9NEOP|nr:hypothetical protein PR048_012569 [Dryococelus australis]